MKQWSKTMSQLGMLIGLGAVSLSHAATPVSRPAYQVHVWLQEEGTRAPLYQTTAPLTPGQPLKVTTTWQTGYLVVCQRLSTPDARPEGLCVGRDTQTLEALFTLTPALGPQEDPSGVTVDSQVHRHAQVSTPQHPGGPSHDDTTRQTTRVPLNTAVQVATFRESETDRLLHINLILRDLPPPR